MYLNQCSSHKQGKYTNHQRTISHDDRVCATEFRQADRISGYAFTGDAGSGVPAEEKILKSGFKKNTGPKNSPAREILDISGISTRGTCEPGRGARFEMTVQKEAYRFKGTA